MSVAVVAAELLIVAAADIDGDEPSDSVDVGVVETELAAVVDTDAVVVDDAETPCVSEDV